MILNSDFGSLGLFAVWFRLLYLFSYFSDAKDKNQLARRTAAMTGLEVARPAHLLGQQGGEVCKYIAIVGGWF